MSELLNSLPNSTLARAARRFLPIATRQWLLAHWPWHPAPAVGSVRFGHFYRLTPFSRHFGYDRGRPIDRYYIEQFIEEHAADIRGRVLEVGDRSYTREFGGDRVEISDVLHVAEGNPEATFVGDLAHAEHLPSSSFDCIILTQTLHLIYELTSALHTLRRILKPHGVVLATVPGITQRSSDRWNTSWYWSFTSQSIQRLFYDAFSPHSGASAADPANLVQVRAYGNVLTAAAFLYGLSAGELRPQDLDFHDPLYEMLIAVHAVKPDTLERKALFPAVDEPA
jgi:SAM-dependent methyltransferase